jgi:hypothetical protein
MFWRTKKQKEFLDRFNEQLRPELIDAMKSPDFRPPLNQLIEQNVRFLIVAVAGASANDMGRNLGVVDEAARKAGWWADYLFSNLALLANGVVLEKAPSPVSRSELLQNIIAELGADCKTLGGERSLPWGDYGSAKRRVYGPFFPDFMSLISRLHQQPFGEHVDINAR